MFNLLPVSFDDSLKCFLVFAFGLILMVSTARRLRIEASLAVVFYLWHTLFCFGYVYFTIVNGADAQFYYSESFLSNVTFDLSSKGIVYLTSFFTQYLEFSFLAVNLVFNIAGAIGMLFFYVTLVEFLPRYSGTKPQGYSQIQMKAAIVVLLPSVSFWSSALGKDSLSMLSVSLFVWSLHKFGTRRLALGAALLLMVFIRSHIAVAFVSAIMIMSAFNFRKNLISSIAIGVVGAGAAVLIAPIFLGLLQLDSLNSSDVADFIGKRQDLELGNSYIAISEMSLPFQMFTYLFRPVVFESANGLQFINSLENTVHLLFFVQIVYLLLSNKVNWRDINIGILLYALIVLFMLASTTTNIGIAVRQKWMIMPALYAIIFTLHNCALVRRISSHPRFSVQPVPALDRIQWRN